MSDSIPTFTPGMPVQIGSIDRELKKLWESGHGAATRASLINLAVYCGDASAMREATALISELTQSHACRAILIATDPGTREPHVQAWISAHCHLGGTVKTKQICCEQITFLLDGDSRGMIPGIVFSHLDSDLPLYLWWREKFSNLLDDQLLSRVDRLIFDSQTCSSPKSRFHCSLAGIAEGNPRLVLCDLNWTRTLYLRQALAQIFDQPDNLSELGKIKDVTITHSPPFRCTALLLAGWLIAQLGWKIEKPGKESFEFSNAGVRGELKFVAGGGDMQVGECSLCSENACFRIARQPGSEFLHADVCTPNGCELHHLLPPGRDDVIHLLNEELMRGGRHQVYLRALAATEQLWQATFQ